MSTIILLVSIILSIYLMLLIRSFGYMSIAELARRSRAGDKIAKKVYLSRKFGLQLWVVLWLIYGFVLSVLILSIDRHISSVTLSLITGTIVIVFMHVILPWARYPKPSLKLAAFASPAVAKLIGWMRPGLRLIDGLLGSWVEIESTTRIHSKEELLEVLQKIPGDLDQIGRDELKIAKHALSFGEKSISQIMTPWSVVKSLRSTDKLGPVFLGELSESGFSRFPVWQGSQADLVGIFYLRDIVEHKKLESVGDHMRPEVFYVNQAKSLDQVLNAFLRTQHHLFIVVNEYEEVVGIITIEDVLEQIIGRQIVDEFDQYEDLRQVAKQQADELRRKRSTGSQTTITD